MRTRPEVVVLMPCGVRDRLTALCEEFEKPVVEGLIISLLKLLHVGLVLCSTLKHRLEHDLCLKERFDFVCSLLVFDIFFDLFVCKQELSDLELMLASETLLK